MTLQIGDRALVIVCELTTGGREDLQWLYQGLESIGSWAVREILDDDYHTVSVLRDQDATRQNFINELRLLGRDPRYKAIDVVIMLHGLKYELYFQDGGISTGELRDEIQALGLEDRLRACFSTACYGATHAPDLIKAGFRVVCGARGIYANGITGVPTALNRWAAGNRFGLAVKTANYSPVVRLWDGRAKKHGFDDADSHWDVFGDAETTITIAAT